MNGIDTGELIRETEIIVTIEIDVTVIGGKMTTQEENAMKGMNAYFILKYGYFSYLINSE